MARAASVSLVLLGLFVSPRGASALQASPSREDGKGKFLAAGKGSFLLVHPPGADYQPETPIKGSPIPVTVECILALCWITMVASMPVFAMWYEGASITKTTVAISVIMWFAFFGGVVLFTNVLSFQSSHFDGIRSLTLVECVYLMSQILTTVGYGDITPALPGSQVFVALYVLCTLLVIANVVSETANLVSKHTRETVAKLEEAMEKQLQFSVLTNTIEDEERALAKVLAHKFPPLPWHNVIAALGNWLFSVGLGVAFYSTWPGEEKTFFQSIYFSIITLSTVGFGAFTALTQAGKAFGAFWMLFGSFHLVTLVGSFTELMSAMRMREKWLLQKARVDEDELFKALPERIDLETFMNFALEYTNLVSHEDLEMIAGTFREMLPYDRKTVSRATTLALFD